MDISERVIMLYKLRKKYYIMRLLAQQFKIDGFPMTLKSLNSEIPTKEMIEEDLNTLGRWVTHPVYEAHLPGYDGKIYKDLISKKD